MIIIDRARDALENSTPGPWRSCAQQRHPMSDCYITAEDGTAVVSAVMPEWARDGVAWNNAALIAAAPELAAEVVRLHDEFAALADEWEEDAKYQYEHGDSNEAEASEAAAARIREVIKGDDHE